jgi:hypothetical protein
MSDKRIIEGLEQAAAHARAASQAQDALSEEGLRQLIWQLDAQIDMTEVLRRPEEQARLRRALAELAVLRARQGAVVDGARDEALERALDFIGDLTADELLDADECLMSLADVQAHCRIELASIRASLARPAPSELPGVEELIDELEGVESDLARRHDDPVGAATVRRVMVALSRLTKTEEPKP